MHLFLDRDGVINVRTIGDYVKTPEEFHFLPGAEQAIADLGKMFEKIFVVTNQSGIGQGIMTHEALAIVHKHMQDSLAPFGAKIEHYYYCFHHRDAGCDCRKPKPGMLKQAKEAFPEIDLSKSWLVGDSVCDMELALNNGLKAVNIIGKEEEEEKLQQLPLDFRFESLKEFADHLSSNPELLKM